MNEKYLAEVQSCKKNLLLKCAAPPPSPLNKIVVSLEIK